ILTKVLPFTQRTVLEDDVTAKFYTDAVDYESGVNNADNVYDERSSRFNIPILYSRKRTTKTTRKSSFREVIKASKKKNSRFVRVHKTIAYSEFTMKDSDLHISDSLVKALSSLPLEYNYALYSRIFEDFGTHYFSSGTTGGTYDLLYQYDSNSIHSSGLTQADLTECVVTETVRRVFFIPFRRYSRKCTENHMTIRTSGSILEASEKSVSMVKGGRVEYAAALAWENGQQLSNKSFVEWEKSVRVNPTVVDFKLRPILGLVKDIPCAVTKRQHLERALMDYMEDLDPCKCRPCPNNGKAVMVDNSCACICRAGTYGDSCEHRQPHYHSEVQDGYWNCWTSWNSCDSSFSRQRSRQCNNPAPQHGGKPCDGPDTQQQHCRISLFAQETTPCVNDNEGRRESATKSPWDPKDSSPHCPRPEPPENSFLRVNTDTGTTTH
ncbi:complement component C6, partial [Amblyraja radiata]|uniref:complement component C6 n=1 Tax=Amblyraja radiata TaxID=386614 RepID=UPI001401E633